MKIVAGDFGENAPASLATTFGGRFKCIVISTGMLSSTTIYPHEIRTVERVTDENKASLVGAFTWGVVGTILAGPIGGFAGALLGGRAYSTILVTLRDGRKFLAVCNGDEHQKLIGATLAKQQIGRQRRPNAGRKAGCSGCAIASVAFIALVFACSGLGLYLTHQTATSARKEIEKANGLWAEKRYEEAVTIYKANYDFAEKDDLQYIFNCIVWYEFAQRKNEAEARRWIKKALDYDVPISVEGTEMLLAQVALENEAEEKHEAEGAKHQASSDLVPTGGVGVLTVTSGKIPICLSVAACDRVFTSAVVDDAHRIAEEVLLGNAFLVENGTRAKVLSRPKFGMVELRIMSGQFAGSRGYCVTDLLHPESGIASRNQNVHPLSAEAPSEEAATKSEAARLLSKVPTPVVHEIREWTDSTGRFKIRARFVSYALGKLKLAKEDGSEIELQIDRLSEEDQAFVRAKFK